MQQLLEGSGAIKHLELLLKRWHCNKFMLVRDSSFPFISIREDIESIGIDRVDFFDFTPNPLYEQVENGIEIFNAECCDAIVAVGGGSTIDVAKCIKLFCKMDKNRVFMRQNYSDTGIPLIAIPTTAGTGSESTVHAVIYWEGKKQSICHPSILPDVAILDKRVLKTLPIYQKKSTMLDALCQGIESWWSVNSNDESRTYSRNAVELITSNWMSYIFDNSETAAANIMLAANYGGRAICITQTTAAHAMSYKITSLYKLPHGHAVAVCLPEVWTYMIAHLNDCIDERGPHYVNRIFYDIANAMGEDTPNAAIEKFRNVMNKMGMNNPSSKNRDEDLINLTSSVNAVRLKNNPVKLDSEALHSLYEIIVK